MSLGADLAAFGSGGVIGFLLGLLGGGGSVLAIPLLLYVVGVPNAHMAIGTSALGVSANALTALVGHARRGTIKWPCAITFAVSGGLGATLGAQLGRLVDPRPLTLLFAAAMMAIAVSMLRPAASGGDPDVRMTPSMMPRLAGLGLVVGLAAGFFGIGGGFLIVPGLMAGSGMPMTNAIGSSLVSVAVFGLATSISYAIQGDVLWDVAALMILGGALGSWAGLRAGRALAAHRAALTRIFAVFVMAVAIYVAWRAWAA